jgi:dihydropteroate synthase
VVEGGKPGAGDQQSGAGDGVEEVQLEATPAGRAEHAEVPLDLEDDEEHLHGEESAPQSREQPEGEAEAADELDADHPPRQQFGKWEAEAVDRAHEAVDAALDLLVSVPGQHRAHHQPDGQQRRSGRQGITPERQAEQWTSHLVSLLVALQELPCPAVPTGNPWLRLGDRRYDLTRRCLVMGILNRTPDSFYDQGATFALDRTLRRADALVADGADILDVGGVKAGPGPAVSETEELDRVVPAVEALVARFDVPVSADTWNAKVLAAACAAGAVIGNDISGFGDPDYLPSAARCGASVVATHIRLAPRVRDPEPRYDDLVADVASFLVDRAERALAAGLAPDQIVLDAGLDLGKTAAQSAVLLRDSERLAGLGYPLLLSASNKTFLGVLLDLPVDARRAPSLTAVAYGVAHGCRIVRVHDVAGTVRVVRLVERILEARAGDGGAES